MPPSERIDEWRTGLRDLSFVLLGVDTAAGVGVGVASKHPFVPAFITLIIFVVLFWLAVSTALALPPFHRHKLIRGGELNSPDDPNKHAPAGPGQRVGIENEEGADADVEDGTFRNLDIGIRNKGKLRARRNVIE